MANDLDIVGKVTWPLWQVTLTTMANDLDHNGKCPWPQCQMTLTTMANTLTQKLWLDPETNWQTTLKWHNILQFYMFSGVNEKPCYKACDVRKWRKTQFCDARSGEVNLVRHRHNFQSVLCKPSLCYRKTFVLSPFAVRTW